MVGDEVAPGPADALEAAHRANGEAAEDLDDEIVGEAASPGSAHRGDSPSGEAAENVSLLTVSQSFPFNSLMTPTMSASSILLLESVLL
jgi:hypothetical protein